MPILLLDGTGERAGDKKGGVALYLAIGLVIRRRKGKKVAVGARSTRLLVRTLAEGWDVMGDLLAGLSPGLILVDGEEELSALAAEPLPGVPVQRCLWHLARGVYRAARYTDRASHDLADDVRSQLAAHPTTPTATVTSTSPAPPYDGRVRTRPGEVLEALGPGRQALRRT